MAQTTGLKHVAALLSKGQLCLLDGAVGTELERRGYETFLPLWTARAIDECPDLLEEIHQEYISAGADIITANTFRTSGYTMGKAAMRDLAQDYTNRAVEVARSAVEKSGKAVAVAGSLAPLEDCYSPHLVPSEAVIHREFSAQLEHLATSGIDLVLVETMINRTEIETITRLLNEWNLPFMISFTVDIDGNLLDGTPLSSIVPMVVKSAPAALLLNCRAPAVITANLSLIGKLGIPFGAYGNGLGSPGGPTGWNWDQSEMSDRSYLAEASNWFDIGARIIGGCCGTSPSTIEFLGSLRRQ